MGELFHIGLGQAILVIGLLLMYIRNADIDTAKKIIFAYVIGTST